jgi:hypothetical protein
VTERQDTTPGMEPVRPGDPATRPVVPGQPVGYPTGPMTGPAPGATAYGAGTATTPDYSPRPVAVRRADVLAGLLMLLAAAAAAISLLLRWLAGHADTGLDLVRRSVSEARGGIVRLVDTGFWQPLAVVGAGAVLLLLGLLVLVPAKRHRFLGLLALLVSAAAAAGVLVPLVKAHWDPATFDIGFWFACAVPVLGLLGALKALFTGRRYRTDPAVAR